MCCEILTDSGLSGRPATRIMDQFSPEKIEAGFAGDRVKKQAERVARQAEAAEGRSPLVAKS
jgi:hypothetical protein